MPTNVARSTKRSTLQPDFPLPFASTSTSTSSSLASSRTSQSSQRSSRAAGLTPCGHDLARGLGNYWEYLGHLAPFGKLIEHITARTPNTR